MLDRFCKRERKRFEKTLSGRSSLVQFNSIQFSLFPPVMHTNLTKIKLMAVKNQGVDLRSKKFLTTIDVYIMVIKVCIQDIKLMKGV